jgi:small subunit ribosomal protein S4
MAKDLNPKCKKCRRAGEKIFLKGERCNTAKCALVKRNFAPGFHGPKQQRKRLSDYGQQLAEKQKAKRQYVLLEKQFKLTFEAAKAKTGNVAENFLKSLEMRFDNVVFRSGFAVSRSQARQMINHGLFTINEKIVNIPSYHTKTGEEIKIKTNKKNAKIFKNLTETIKKHEAPGWLNVDMKEIKSKVLHQPGMDVIKPNFNIQMIVEYYSR